MPPSSHQITIGRAPVGRDTTGRHGHGRRACSCPARIGTASSLELARFKPKRLPPPQPRAARRGRGRAWSVYRRGTQAPQQPYHQYGFAIRGSWPRRFQAQHEAACPRSMPPARLPASRRDHATRSYARADGRRGRHHTKQPVRQPGWQAAGAPLGAEFMTLCTRPACLPACSMTTARGPLAWDSAAGVLSSVALSSETDL